MLPKRETYDLEEALVMQKKNKGRNTISNEKLIAKTKVIVRHEIRHLYQKDLYQPLVITTFATFASILLKAPSQNNISFQNNNNNLGYLIGGLCGLALGRYVLRPCLAYPLELDADNFAIRKTLEDSDKALAKIGLDSCAEKMKEGHEGEISNFSTCCSWPYSKKPLFNQNDVNEMYKKHPHIWELFCGLRTYHPSSYSRYEKFKAEADKI